MRRIYYGMFKDGADDYGIVNMKDIRAAATPEYYTIRKDGTIAIVNDASPISKMFARLKYMLNPRKKVIDSSKCDRDYSDPTEDDLTENEDTDLDLDFNFDITDMNYEDPDFAEESYSARNYADEIYEKTPENIREEMEKVPEEPKPISNESVEKNIIEDSQENDFSTTEEESVEEAINEPTFDDIDLDDEPTFESDNIEEEQAIEEELKEFEIPSEEQEEIKTTPTEEDKEEPQLIEPQIIEKNHQEETPEESKIDELEDDSIKPIEPKQVYISTPIAPREAITTQINLKKHDEKSKGE